MINNKKSVIIVLLFLATVSIATSITFFSRGQNLSYADAISRLDISRKVVDNITPGLAQLGNVWLPLPQILMLPFIWIDSFWHTGLAGAIMSMSSFILGGYFIFKTAYLITKSYLGSLLSVSIYALNINLLYLQTTAMSEALFVCTLAGTTYYFLKWFKTDAKFDLILAAFWVSAMTFTRYEGLALLLSSIPMVFVYTYLKSRKYQKAEGTTIIYAVLACLGFGLWTLYLTLIFKDPLYWKNYYANPSQVVGSGVAYYSQAKPFIQAVWQYFTSFVWMIGLIPTILTLLGVVVLIIQSIRRKSLEFMPVLLPLSIFLFMVLTLQRNTPIVQPDLTIANILSRTTSLGTGFNIRYGLLLLPWAAIMSAYVFQIKSNILKILIFSFFGIQIFSYAYPNYTVIYQIPARIYGKSYADLVSWMKQNYDGGKILISASSHEDQMFEMGFSYDTYIHEGNGKYWKESIDNPSRYATWVVIDKGHKVDQIAKKLTRVDILDRDYDVVYDKDQVKIYKIKTKPYFEIK